MAAQSLRRLAARFLLCGRAMTAPRRIVPQATVMITRRCLDRMYLLRPSRLTNQLFQYILAVAAQRFRVRLHALCVMSNHFHLVLTDDDGTLPAFEQYLDSLVARSLNALHGRWDYFWSAGSYSCVTLVEPSDVLAKIAYVLTNPVHAGLVHEGAEWPGAWTGPEVIGGEGVLVRRPEHFFRENGPMPPSACLRFVCPPGFDSADEFRAALVAAVRAREAELRESMAAEGRAVLGATRVLAQRADGRSATVEPHRRLEPTVACRDRDKRAAVLGRLREFRAAYRAAWTEFTSGVHDVIFPHGTYSMRVAFGVRCAPG